MLPLEIREQIYGYLLSSHHVKEAPPDLDAAVYKFHTAVLAKNRSISLEVQRVLQRNIFIVLSINGPVSYSSLRREGVSIVPSHHVAKFKDHLLRVNVKLPMLATGSISAFLLVADDLLQLCRFLRLHNLIRPLHYVSGIKVQLQLRSTATHKAALAIQKLLLEPFKQAYCGAMRTSITGPVDVSYRQETLTKMKPDQHHINKEGWYAYQFSKEIKQEGDRSFRCGKLERARERYITYNATVRCQHYPLLRTLFQTEGTEWLVIAYGLVFRALFNEIPLNTHCKDFDPEALRLEAKILRSDIPHSINFPTCDLARLAHCVGLVHAELGENEHAISLLVETLQQSDSPENIAIENSLELVKGSQEGFRHRGISQRVLGNPVPIMEESGVIQTEKEFEIWRKMTEAHSI